MAELTRNYEASRQNYQSLLDKTFSAGMSEALEQKQEAERFTVLDPARTPEKPIRPKRLPIMAGVLMACFILPAGLTFWFHLLRGSINSESEVREMLSPGVPVLGTLPRIRSKADQIRGRLLMAQTVIVSLFACTALVIFLLKTRPVL